MHGRNLVEKRKLNDTDLYFNLNDRREDKHSLMMAHEHRRGGTTNADFVNDNWPER